MYCFVIRCRLALSRLALSRALALALVVKQARPQRRESTWLGEVTDLARGFPTYYLEKVMKLQCGSQSDTGTA